MTERSDDRPPWDKKNPKKTGKKTAKKKKSTPLTEGQKHEARARARKAGRKYPNLVDNMAVARKRKTTAKEANPKTTASKAKRKTTGKKAKPKTTAKKAR